MLGGELVSHLLSVVLLTVLIAPLVLWRYRRAVLAGMQGKTGADLPMAPVVPRTPAAPATTDAVEARLAWERRTRRRVFAASLLAAAVPSLVLAAQRLLMGDQPTTPAHLWIMAGAGCSVAVPVFAVLTATPLRRALPLWIGTLVALSASGVLLSMLQRPFYGKVPSLDQLMNFVLFFQLVGVSLWVPMLMGLATGARRVRGVAPLTFAGLLVFGLAPLLGRQVTRWLGSTETGSAWLLTGAGLETGFVLVALPFGLLAWQRLKALARAYERKRFSDAQLLARTWWLLIVAGQAVELVSVYPGIGPLCSILAVSALAYLMFPPLLVWGLRRAFASETRPAPRTLLLLRVFGDTARTEALFDRVALRWQLFGPVTMIAAPDVAARTVDPGDFLRFALGNIGATFVNSQADLDQRMATLDKAPDPDGRYRLSEFCCRDSTWQATVAALMQDADAVVMDLRGFTAKRMGCEFELRQLAQRMRADQVVLVVDGTTDRALLEGYLGAGDARMRTIEITRAGGADAAFDALLRAAA
ncbi:MAG: hypothetical protein ABI702_11205 [Burkholderiales bacterium]